MKTLIVDDDFTCRLLLLETVKSFGTTHAAVNGIEAVEAVQAALETEEPYQLICLDITMPGMDGQEVLKRIRQMEVAKGIKSMQRVKVIMTTTLSDAKNIMTAFVGLSDAYLEKPIDRSRLLEHLQRFKLTGLHSH